MRFLYLLSFILLFSCKNFQQVQLEQTEPVNPDLALGTIPSSNALLVNGDGTIDDFSEASHNWEDDFDNIKTYTLNGNIIINADTAIGEAFLYRNFNPLNFEKVGYLVIKSENEGQKVPYFVTFTDTEGNEVLLNIEKTENNSYYYPLNNDALKTEFNLKRVNEIRIYIGSPKNRYSGQILIDYIKAVK